MKIVKLILFSYILSNFASSEGGCNRLCTSCSERDPNVCKSCKTNAILQPDNTCKCIPNSTFNSHLNKCECDPGFFLKEQTCVKQKEEDKKVHKKECNPLCLSCSDEDTNICKDCKENTILESNTCKCIENAEFIRNKDRCECIKGYYLLNGICALDQRPQKQSEQEESSKPESESEKVNVLAIVITTVVITILILIVLVFVYYKCLRKRRVDEYGEPDVPSPATPGSATSDKDVYTEAQSPASALQYEVSVEEEKESNENYV